MLEIHPLLLLYQGVIFVVFVFLLYRFALRPLAKMVRDRQTNIEASINQAEQNQKATENLKNDYENRLVRIEDEQKKLIDTALAEGNRIKDEVINSARDEANKHLEKAKAEIEHEKNKMLMEAKGEIGIIAIEILQKVLKQTTTKEMEEKLAASLAEELDSEKWKN
jgi:F-type H+-transporting ATPase subunit b